MLAPLAFAALSLLPLQDSTPPTPDITVLDEDPQRRYILHAPAQDKAPRDGWKLLVVMPGGSGDPDFAPFVGRIADNALDDTWLIAQMVAPVWDPEQAKNLVWPTEKNPWPKMKFSCEELFEAVVDDVAEKYELDARYLFTLAWSSSGPLAYSLALQKKTRITGTFIAMSVYKPDLLPSLRNARKRNFYLLHSPEDFIPIAMAEKAEKELSKKGAEVKFVTYSGGHGWHGNVYGMLREGVQWLENKAPKRKRR